MLGFIELHYFSSEQIPQIHMVERIWMGVLLFAFEFKLNKIFEFLFEKSNVCIW